MKHELPDLPYAKNALEPHISQETLEYHHGKHHNAYVTKLNEMIPGTEFENLPLEDIIRKASGGLFNQAAQIWNHTFYWNSLSPKGGGEPSGKLKDAIERDFGSVDKCKEALAECVKTHFGSGWAWLVAKNGKLAVEAGHDADNPLRDGGTPLLTIDAWEHAFYIDYRNAKPKYVEAVLENLINWDFAAKNFAAVK